MSFKESFTSFFLNKSDKYNYYKNNFKKVNKANKKLDKANKHLYKNNTKLKLANEKLKNCKNEMSILRDTYVNMQNEYKTKISEMEKWINEERNSNIIQDKILLYTKELAYANVFNNTIKNSNWLENESFSLINGAANYSFMYLIYRILNDFAPKNILEFGLGQTTKLTSQYICNDSKTSLLVIDNDQSWIDNFSKNLSLCENVVIKHVPEEAFYFDSTENIRYSNLKNHVNDKKFDFILVDGPVGLNQEYPRTNIWDIVNENLKEEFIIIIDDYERIGERNTVKHLLKILDNNNIYYNTVAYSGLKEQFIIFTEKFKSLFWV